MNPVVKSKTLPASPASMVRILLIASQGSHAAHLWLKLQEEGYAVHFSRDAIKGLEYARQHPPDLILLDTNLTALSTIQMLSCLKDNTTTVHIPIITLTSHDRDGEHRLAWKVGADFCVCKDCTLNRPDGMRMLCACIELVLSKHHWLHQVQQPIAVCA